MSFRVSNNLNAFRSINRAPDHVQINTWFGRFGNNVIQIINGLHIALGLKKNLLISVQHSLLKSIDLFIEPHQLYFYRGITESNGFYFQNYIYSEYFNKNHEIVKNKVKDLLKIDITNLVYDNEEDLVVHIRGGDTLKNNNKDYKPLPFSFYEEIIESQEWKNITLVCEDKNYITDHFTKKYPHISFNLQNLEEDIKTILKSKNLIMSVGTFIPALLIFSKNVKNVYKVEDPNFQNLEIYTDHKYIIKKL